MKFFHYDGLGGRREVVVWLGVVEWGMVRMALKLNGNLYLISGSKFQVSLCGRFDSFVHL